MWEYLTLIAQWVPEEKNKSGHWLINEEYSTEQLAETLNLFGKAEWEIIICVVRPLALAKGI